MNLKPTYPAGANTTGLIVAGLLIAFGYGLMQPVVGLVARLAGGALSMAAEAQHTGG